MADNCDNYLKNDSKCFKKYLKMLWGFFTSHSINLIHDCMNL